MRTRSSSVLSLVIAATVLSGCSSLKSKKGAEGLEDPAGAAIQPARPDNAAAVPMTDGSPQAGASMAEADASGAGAAAGGNKGQARTGKPGGAPGSAGGEAGGSYRGGAIDQLTSQTDLIFFAFDDYSLGNDDKAVLREAATLMKNQPKLKLELLGHADERGTVNYNLALGERRGKTVETYLRTLGIAADRLEVISYGETKPRVEGHEESAWAGNRRVELNWR